MKENNSRGIYEKCFKRIFDLFFALLFLIAFLWLYAVIAVLVRVKLGSPVIFRQQRPGKDEKLFDILKFRTMTDEKDENGVLLDDDKRITEFGKKLRLSSLDELPEVVNVVKGEMSFVGPRPLLPEYLPYYTEDEKKRHSVRPGMTGLAQINGRNCADSWEQRFENDISYVENISFSGDMKIIFATLKNVFSKKDVEPGGGIKQGRLDEIRSGKTTK